MYNLWEVLRPLENFINFRLLEQKIITLKDLVNQGYANDKLLNAVKNNEITLSATFENKNSTHTLLIKGVVVDGVKKNLELNLLEIFVKDVEIDGVSIIDDGNKIFGYIL